MASEPLLGVRKSPCPTCPYRCNVPSGVWDASEYERLRKFDGDIGDQVQAGAIGLFLCHQTGQELCAGWVGHRKEPADLLALRLGVAREEVDPAVMAYTTTTRLFPSGAAAHAHGIRDVETPSPEAIEAAAKIRVKRRLPADNRASRPSRRRSAQ